MPNELMKIEVMTGKKFLTLQEAANYTGMELDDFTCLLSSANVKVDRSNGKEFIRSSVLAKFIEGSEDEAEGQHNINAVDNRLTGRYLPPVVSESIGEKEYKEMERRGKGTGTISFIKSRNIHQGTIEVGTKPNGERDRKYLYHQDREFLEQMMKEFIGNMKPITLRILSAVA